MEPASLTWVGSPCGSHGPYTFYKAFRFNLGCETRLLSLGDFFVVRCEPGEPLCIAELQLLWEERTNHQLLSSSKLYFLPEDTPQGRSASHGEDEVIAVSEKVVVRLKDLVKWTVWDQHAWDRGMKALPLKMSSITTDSFLRYHDSTLNCGLHFKDVLREKAALGNGLTMKKVLVLSYPRYCRYRSVVARIHEQPRSLLTNQVVLALGGIVVLSENMHILYCRDTFHHPTLLHNQSICEEFAPNLKGRPRKKKLSNSLFRDSQSQKELEVKGHCQKSLFSKETDATAGGTTVKVTADKAGLSKPRGSSDGSNRINHSSQTTTLALSEERRGRGRGRGRGVEYRAEEQAFLVSLYKYMKERKTPIDRIPYLGFKQINLWTMFQAAQKLGGYELITARRQWKNVYDELGGNPGSTSAATCTRRHYERLILPYEKFIRGEEDKTVKPRKQEAGSDKESSNSVCTPILKTKPSPDKNEDHSRLELMEQNSQLKLEPQICITRLDPLQPSHSLRKRGRLTQDCQNETEIQPMLEQEDKVKRKRRYSGCDPSYLTTSLVTKDNKSVFPLAAPKIFNHAHSAVDLWQHQQVPLQDQGHIEKPRNLKSPTIPEPPSEQAELPRTEDTSSGFTTLFDSSGVSNAIMSPLAKKIHGRSNFDQPPLLINSSLTSCITEEAAEQPVVGSNSSVVELSRPSVIQHVQSFKVEKDRATEIKASTPLPLYSHGHFHHVLPSLPHQKQPRCPLSPLVTPKMPKSSWTPQGFHKDLSSSCSQPHHWHRAADKGDGVIDAELVHDGSKQHHEQGATLSRDPASLVGFLQSADVSKYSAHSDLEKYCNPRTTAFNEQPTDLSLPKSSPKPLTHSYTACPPQVFCKSTPMLSQNGLTAINIAHYSIARQVPPVLVAPANTCSPRQHPAVESFTRATEEAVNGTVHNGGGVKKQEAGDEGEQKQFETALYNKLLHNICGARPFNELGNHISKRRRQAVTPAPKDLLSLSPSRKIESPKELDNSFGRENAEEVEGGPAASSFFLLKPISQIPDTLIPARTLALTQVRDLCRNTLSIPYAMDQPHSSDSHLQNPHQYLKTQSTDFVSPMVPPIAIYPSIIQRQLLDQTAASPIRIYQQTYGNVIHHRLYSVSVNPQPTSSQLHLNSVQPSTKLP
ncbi:AT-rich interactive domain-containing protein 5B-like isoform X2 [Dicentrarchus labrax]|uniref:AT-rich interactive domain-containing protein 5B n=1 Tax=Dicentrarchus labrax TaxID=13489 RepID=A0A8P4G232_DICLA|nr:AT-rich interactive domain-containing protein 5B-like isoform X2 [Dicentrarchus labrax]